MKTYSAAIITALDKFKTLFEVEFHSTRPGQRFFWWHNSEDPTQPQIEIHPDGVFCLELGHESRPGPFNMAGLSHRDYEMMAYLYKPLAPQPMQGMGKGEASQKEMFQFFSDFEDWIESKSIKQVVDGSTVIWQKLDFGSVTTVPGLYKQKPIIVMALSIIFTIPKVRKA